MHPDGAREVTTRAGTMGHAQSASALVAHKNLVDPARRRSLHDRAIHNEHRPLEEIPEDGLRARNPLLNLGRLRGFIQKRRLTAEIAECAEQNPACVFSILISLCVLSVLCGSMVLISLRPAIKPRDTKSVRPPGSLAESCSPHAV